MIIEIIPCLSDNYSYVISEKETDTISIVDPSEFKACDKVINKYKKLDFILNTHHHTDHVGANLELKKKYNSKILGSSSDQIFELICKAYLKKGDEVVVPKYSFIIYRIYSKNNGAKVVFAKEKNFTVSVKEILAKVSKKTKIVFLANPNNPTGTLVNKKDLLSLRRKLRNDILLVIDDAYFEYVNQKNFQSGLKLFKKNRNVLITRTFSKIYGLAGLRVGWGYASQEIINALNKIKPPFNVSRPALFAASAAVKDGNWLKKEIKHINKWNKILFNIFKKMKIETNESESNFLLVNFDRVTISSNKVFKKLANLGILVRKMEVYGIKNSLRITIGKSEENRKLISILRRILNVR